MLNRWLCAIGSGLAIILGSTGISDRHTAAVIATIFLVGWMVLDELAESRRS